MTRIQGASGTTTATFTVKAPFVNLENLTFRKGSSTVAGLKIDAYQTNSAYAFNVTVFGCAFWKIGLAGAGAGGLVIDSAWHTVVDSCWFEACRGGIAIANNESNTDGFTCVNTVFNGLDTDIDFDIYTSGTLTTVLIDRCIFAHDIPAYTGGSVLKYISFATATGLFSNSVIGSETNTIATNCSLSNIDVSNVTYAPGTNFTA